MKDRFETLLSAVLVSVQGPTGKLDERTRADLVAGKPLTGALGAFATKVTENAASITDDHVATLRARGVDEESIFDCVIAAALGAGLARLRAAKRALEGVS